MLKFQTILNTFPLPHKQKKQTFCLSWSWTDKKQNSHVHWRVFWQIARLDIETFYLPCRRCQWAQSNGRRDDGLVGGGWRMVAHGSGWLLKWVIAERRWWVGDALGQCVAFWSFIWTLVLFHCQLVCPFCPSSRFVSPYPALEIVLSLSGHMCGTSKLQAKTKPSRTDPKGRLREPIVMANDRLAESQWTFVTECRLLCGRWVHLEKIYITRISLAYKY